MRLKDLSITEKGKKGLEEFFRMVKEKTGQDISREDLSVTILTDRVRVWRKLRNGQIARHTILAGEYQL